MKRQTFRTLFYIKKSKRNKFGEAPIYLRITVDGKIVENSIKRAIDPGLWDNVKQRAKGRRVESIELNEYLEGIQYRIKSIQRNMFEDGIKLTADLLRNKLFLKNEENISLIELFERHNNEMKDLVVAKEIVIGSYKKYLASVNHVKHFLNLNYSLKDIQLNQVDHKFIYEYEHYLKTYGGCKQNTATRHLKHLKKVFRIALHHGYIKNDPFLNIKMKYTKSRREFLTYHEINLLKDKQISNHRLEKVKDLFLFQIFTGLSFKDLMEVKINNIDLDIDGNEWLTIRRKKTEEFCRIPILPIVKDLINKYENELSRIREGKLMPSISNSNMNAYLKEIADICGIDKKLTSHVGRHTFASTVTLENGVAMEVVSKMMGHAKVSTTQIYAKVGDYQVKEQMNLLKSKII